jgi:hypothetical protein
MSNDALNIILSVGGILIGVIVSWVFFRAQQQTDFNKLRDSLSDISNSVAILKDANKLSERIDLVKDFAALRASVDTLGLSVSHLSATIIDEVRGQQKIFMKSVQEEFERQVEKSQKVLESSIERELRKSIPRSPEQEIIISKLADLVKHAMHSMGEYQRVSFQNQSETALQKVEGKVVGAIGEVKKDVEAVKNQVTSLPKALPPSKQIKSS